MKFLFTREPQQGITTWCLVVLSILLMVMDHRYHQLEALRGYLSLAVYPVQWVVDAPFRLIASIQDYTHTHKTLVNENKQLKHEQFLLSAKTQKLQALEAENARLRALMQSSPHNAEGLLVAEIIRINSDPFIHRIILDKGIKHGVKVGQPVIDAEGIIGEVIELNTSTCKVILLTDASYGIPVENVRNGVRGIVAGTGAISHLELQHVPSTTDLKEGDLLVTSGLDGHYPPGYPVGTIKQIENNKGESFARIKVVPRAHLDKTRQVLLIQRLEDEE